MKSWSLSAVLATLVAWGTAAVAGQAAATPRVVFLIGEDEYKTEITLPAFARSDLEPKGLRVRIIHAAKDDPNDFPGMERALADADLVVVSIRRRTPPRAQLDALRAYLDAGKPLVGIRTACHAFALRARDTPKRGLAQWPEFDPQVIGGHYTNHHGDGPKVDITRAKEAGDHPILRGLDLARLQGNGSLYKVSPLEPGTTPLLIGTIPDKDPEPVAWTHTYGTKHARVFYTSLGHPDDFDEPEFHRLLANGIAWALDRPASDEASEVKTTKRLTPSRAEDRATIAPAGMDRDLKTSANVASLRIPDDLELDLLLQEPLVANPLYLNFDERGRMWVVQYRQYPWPSGLKLLSRDNVWRNVYDAVPPPPPQPVGSKFRGKDIITIHEDHDGDGVFDKARTFLEGLSLATAALKGRGGVFVLNPPYLLFYADKDDNDVLDGETPRILLSGFGIEDTHAVANNLRWGPDGWIYATQGSTVSASIVRHGPDGKPMAGEKPVHTMGQNVWRYHPEMHRYEVFAEGGGNAFGVEIDSKGRVYSGHNGGDTRGFYYIQGGYYRKGFDKHGELSNPYAFGYINGMRANKSERFTHTFSIYEADKLPDRYLGNLFGVAPHNHYVIRSEIFPDGATFQTRDIAQVIVPNKGARDAWFTPVDIQIGPDGAFYLADWYSVQANHYRNHEGKTNPDLGRVYRLRAKGAGPSAPIDLGKLSSADLVDRTLNHPNRWYRQTALRLLGDRKDASLVPKLRALLRKNTGQLALEAFWALNLCGGLDEASALKALKHDEPHVRRWAVRLQGDANRVSPAIAAQFVAMAANEPDVEARCQLASTAKRLPTDQALPVIARLMDHREDSGDIDIPGMLWWALEAHANDREALLSLFEAPTFWSKPIKFKRATFAQLVMKRYATAGSQDDLLACARLLALAPGQADSERLVRGFGEAFEGRPIPPLPDPLTVALARAGGPFAIVLDVRRGDAWAMTQAIATAEDEKAPLSDRLLAMRALGDVSALPAKAVPALLRVVAGAGSDAVRNTALSALQKYPAPEIGPRVVDLYGGLSEDVKTSARVLLASRAEWALALLQAIDAGKIDRRAIEPDTVEQLRAQKGPKMLVALLDKLFPNNSATKGELETKIARLASLVREGKGNPLAGKALFHGKASCVKCHTIFNQGGHIGPDLTPYDRSNLENMLLAIVNPSAEIREGYENFTVVTADGRVLTGLKVDGDKNVFVLRGVDGQDNVIPLDQIEESKANRQSLMPEGMLDTLGDDEIRDLFAFLASTTPPK